MIDLSAALSAEQAPNVVPEANGAGLAGLKGPLQVSSPSSIAAALARGAGAVAELINIERIMYRRPGGVEHGRESVSPNWRGKRPSC